MEHVLCTCSMQCHPYRREREIIYSTLDYQGLCMDMYYAHCTCIDIHTGERERVFTARWTNKDIAWNMYYAHVPCNVIHTGERERLFTARWTIKDIAWNMYYAHVPCNVIHTGEREREYLQHAGLPRTLHGHVLCTLYMHRHPYRRERESIYSTLD